MQSVLWSQSASRRRELIQLAASVEQHSEHPLGAAIVAHAEESGIEPQSVREFRNQPGRGALATIGASTIAVGNSSLMSELGVAVSEAESAETPVYVARDGQIGRA